MAGTLWRRWRWYALVLLIVLLDQCSKSWVQANFFLYQRVDLLPVLDLALVYNKGAAWSFLSDAGGWQRTVLTAISAVVSVVLALWICRITDGRGGENKLLLWSLVLILGGAIGNLIDRVLLGEVVDFILFHYRDWHFPVFNAADSAITVGAFLMLYDSYCDWRNERAAGSE